MTPRIVVYNNNYKAIQIVKFLLVLQELSPEIQGHHRHGVQSIGII